MVNGRRCPPMPDKPWYRYPATSTKFKDKLHLVKDAELWDAEIFLISIQQNYNARVTPQIRSLDAERRRRAEGAEQHVKRPGKPIRRHAVYHRHVVVSRDTLSALQAAAGSSAPVAQGKDHP